MTSIRRAVLEDMAAVAVLHRHTTRTSLPFLPDLYTPEQDRAFFQDQLFPGRDVWVAEEDGVIVAYAARGDGWLNHLFVHPDHQGTGLGDTLLALATEGMDTLQLWTFQANHRARRFYETRGFVLAELADGSGNAEKTPDARYVWRRT
jgi:GNAT superfamily N-acetyltransferase